MTESLALPLPLLLLINLYILDYPNANNSEYDLNIFDPHKRGLRERTKSMEDICYFLVGTTEARAKVVLPMYPCLKPSDTVGFRNLLAKYLETLRHDALHPETKSKGKVKGNSSTSTDPRVAWWWKDVVVRKSLLEDCSGERFERLLVSFSTHCLFKKTSGRHLANVTPETTEKLFQSLPQTYAIRLARFQSTRNVWVRSASLLIEHEADLQRVREHLEHRDGNQTSSKYHTLSTERLLALAEFRFRDLLQDHWHEVEGHAALTLLTELAGLKRTLSSDSKRPFTFESVEALKIDDTDNEIPAVPLPLAAAHHPLHIRKLGRSVFASAKGKSRTKQGPETAPTNMDLKTHACIALSDQSDAEKRMDRTLTDALSRARRANEQLKVRMAQIGKTEGSGEMVLDLERWGDEGGVDFKTRPTLSLLSTFSLYAPPQEEGALEARIDHIREHMLPARIPPVITPAPSRLPQPVPKPKTLVTPAPRHESESKNGELAKAGRRRRSSIRESLTVARRPPLAMQQGVDEDEVYRIAEGVEDEDEDEEYYDVLTPGRRKTKVRLLRPTRGSEDEGWDEEGPSVTLRDILLQAGGGPLGELDDLLEDGLGNESEWE